MTPTKPGYYWGKSREFTASGLAAFGDWMPVEVVRAHQSLMAWVCGIEELSLLSEFYEWAEMSPPSVRPQHDSTGSAEGDVKN